MTSLQRGGTSEVFRIYAPDECGTDGYPFAWHRLPVDQLGEELGLKVESIGGVKDVVREFAGHRCERCLHPFRVGTGLGRWSPCDDRCDHGGPCRARVSPDRPWEERRASVGDLAVAQSNGNQVQAEYRILAVHHLNGVKADLRWWNLAALCQRCHLQIQGRVQMERVWPWEHSDWFKPHAAGWYAFAYLDEDITREEAIERMDELLALERAA